MTRFVAELLSSNVLNAFKNQLSKFQFDEDFLEVVFPILKSRKFRPDARTCFLDIVIERYEIGIELLNSKIQSYNFWDPKEFWGSLPSPKQEEIVLPLELHIEDDCAFKYQAEDVVSRFNTKDRTDQIVMEGLEEKFLHHAFIDPVADYM